MEILDVLTFGLTGRWSLILSRKLRLNDCTLFPTSSICPAVAVDS
jgi:hypothetical protein